MLRTSARGLPEQIANRIAKDVQVPGDQHLWREKVREGAALAVAGFFDDQAAAIAVRRFNEFGRAWAPAEAGPLPVLDAIQTAMASLWEAMQRLAEQEQLTGQVMVDVGTAVSDYLRRLRIETERGHREARIALSSSRSTLLSVLLKGAQSERSAAELAADVAWLPPRDVVVLVGDLHGETPPARLGTGPEVLVLVEGDRISAVCASRLATAARETMLRIGPRVVVAEMWPVPLDQARDGYRWARRALELARDGKLRPVGRVVQCRQHRLRLWIGADDVLAHEVSADILAPLLAQRPSTRKALGKTMLRWLPTRESAPALAVYFGVHPNTIRNRQQKLYEMFGDRLDDPDHVLALILALRTMRSVFE